MSDSDISNTGTTEAVGRMKDAAALNDARWGRQRYTNTRAIGNTPAKKSIRQKLRDLLPWVDRAVPVERHSTR